MVYTAAPVGQDGSAAAQPADTQPPELLLAPLQPGAPALPACNTLAAPQPVPATLTSGALPGTAGALTPEIAGPQTSTPFGTVGAAATMAALLQHAGAQQDTAEAPGAALHTILPAAAQQQLEQAPQQPEATRRSTRQAARR